MCKYCDINHISLADTMLVQDEFVKVHMGVEKVCSGGSCRQKPVIYVEEDSNLLIYRPKFCPECGRSLK